MATDDGSVGHAGPVTDLLLAELGRDAHAEVYACGPPACSRPCARICVERGVPGAARARVGHGLRLRRLLRLRRRDQGTATSACASTAPCSTPPSWSTCERSSTSTSPVVNASGTFDAIAARRAFGDALLERFPFAAFVTKTVTLAPRQGNPPPRLYELPGGLMNSIGLPNKGLDGFLADDLPQARRAAGAADRQRHGRRRTRTSRGWSRRCGERDEVAALELNVSCPNVKTGLMFGADPARGRGAARRGPAAHGKAADRQAHAQLRKPRRRRRGRRGAWRRRRFA